MVQIFATKIWNFPKKLKPNLRAIFANNFNVLFWLLYGQKISDLLTGYKLYERDFFKKNKIKTNGFETDHEISAKLVKEKYKIIEVPVKYNPRSIADGKNKFF